VRRTDLVRNAVISGRCSDIEAGIAANWQPSKHRPRAAANKTSQRKALISFSRLEPVRRYAIGPSETRRPALWRYVFSEGDGRGRWRSGGRDGEILGGSRRRGDRALKLQEHKKPPKQ
jgi:hypothetical protein